VDWLLLEQFALLEPFGSGNPKPVVELSGLVVMQVARIGAEGKHLRLKLRDGAGRNVAAIGFGLAARYRGLREGQHLTARGELNKNEFQGRSTLQLVVSELRYE
jgi:single-stranded-DNA-specific exonuclease